MRWLGPIIGATLSVVFAWTAALFQATAEIFVAASLLFSVLEGVVCAFIGSSWASRGAPIATVVAAITAVLAVPGRWEVAYLRNGQMPQLTDLMFDLLLTVAWGAFCGLAGATLLRDRLQSLSPASTTKARGKGRG